MGARACACECAVSCWGANVQQQRVREKNMVATLSYIPCPSPRTRPRRPAGAPPSRRRPSAPARKEKREGRERSYGYESPCTSRRSSWPSPTPQVQPLRAILRNDMPSSQQYPAGVPGAPPGGATTPSSAAKSTDLTTATRSMRRQRRGKGRRTSADTCCTGTPRRGVAWGHPGDGGHDADARSGRARADRGLLSGCTLLRSALEQPRTAKGATSRRRRWRHGTCATMGSAVEAVPEGPLPPGFEPCKRPPSPRPASAAMPF